LPRSVWGLFALVSLVLGALTAVLLGTSGSVSYTGAPQLQLPLPASSAGSGSAPPGAAAAVVPLDTAAGAPVLPALIEPGPFGPLPRIAADGQRPFLAYALPFAADELRPQISLLILGLGLQADQTEAALRLPGEVALHFSAYASDLPALVARARAAGHEVLLDLPMEPLDYPYSDPGPHTLLAGNPLATNLERLDWLLARAQGYVALAGAGAGFATSASAPPVLDVLAGRGLALVEIGAGELAGHAAAVGLPYANAPVVIDRDPSLASIDYALAGLEAEALASGSALGVAQGYPVSLERLRLWATTLEHKGLVLAPVSAFVIERSGLAADSGDGGRPARRARG
jgi:polysaccharide deacetylase 2 family uncharacterized protein YibQ